jgi:hypothetical protein
VGEPLRAAVAGHDAELDLRLAELGVVGGDDQVALHGELAAAAERKAGDRRDHRLAGARDGVLVGAEIVQENVQIVLARHLLDVGTGGERFFRAGDDDAADAGVGLQRRQRGHQLRDQRGVERIERLRPVEPDDADAAFGFDDDVVRHDGRLDWGARAVGAHA